MYVWRRLMGKRSKSVRRSDYEMGKLNTENLKTEENWQLKLLSGEEIISRAGRIVRSDPCGCSETDEIGELVVTNFRIIFISCAEKEDENCVRKEKILQRSKLIGNNDIALYNIDIIYNVKKKRKKIVEDGIIPRQPKTIEIHCKDFRVHMFHLKFLSDKNEGFLILSAIVDRAYPQQLHSLFAFKYKGETSQADDVPQFNSEQDWTELLEQKRALGAFRVVLCNKDFRVSDSLPESFVVPSSLNESDVVSSIKKFSNNRCPVWSYTHSNGASIVRMASAIAGVGEELETEMIEHVRISSSSLCGGGGGGAGCVVVDLNKRFPSLLEIHSNCRSIQSKCMPGNLKEFWLSDAVWFSSLESSHWLSSISCCLKVAREMATNIVKGKTVILKELDAVDFCPVVSCLTQIILDPSVRTLEGFQCLIEREWVALGHKFAERHGNCNPAKTNVRSSIFLLFLDCVWQLVNQFPSQIQFTEYFLVSVWDSVCLGIFRNFLFDDLHSSYSDPTRLPSHEAYITRLKPPALLSAWDWEKQFSDEQIALFYSPLYVYLHDRTLRDRLVDVTVDRFGLSSSIDSKGEKSSKAAVGLFLTPDVESCRLRFWSLCYLRWLPAAEVIGGGSASEYLSQCILVEEILFLCQTIEAANASKRSHDRRSSRLIFGLENGRPFVRHSSSICISSSFPFSVNRPPDARLGPSSFIDSYFKNSVLYGGNSGGPGSDEFDD